MTEELFKNPIGVRGDSLYCPLALSIDSYWNCEPDCHHCYFRRLNSVWGSDLRPADPELVEKKLRAGLKNPNPKSSLACALKQKKTLRLGNKTDPYQPVEKKRQITRRIAQTLVQLEWTFVVQTRFISSVERDLDIFALRKDRVTFMPIISPGLESDQVELERGRTPPIEERLDTISKLIRLGYSVGVNGEPFIPGYHTPEMFEETVKRLKSVGVKSYNTYNFHFNDFVAKRLWKIGVDIERIWEMNQDKNWKPILQTLCDIAKKHDMILGCPDFVNVKRSFRNATNTCCGINVENPTTFNAHTWRNQILDGKDFQEILANTWDGVGDYAEGERVLYGRSSDMYTMRDARLVKDTEGTLL